MTKVKKGILSCACLAVVVAVGVPLSKSIGSGEVDTTPTWSDISVLSTYGLYDTFTIPERTLSIGAEDYDADIKLLYPDGSVKMVSGGDITFTTAGQYTLIYEAKDNNAKYYKEEVDFFVHSKLWSTSKAGSSIVYDKLGDTYGLMVRLAKNDTLSFNKTIELADLKATDTFLKGFVTPDVVGAHDFGALVFTLTDVYNPSEYITIRCTKSLDASNMYGTSYWTSAAPGQVLGGYDYGNYRTEDNIGWRGTATTTVTFYSQKIVGWLPSTAVYQDIVADELPFTICYDKDNLQAYVNTKMISDFDDETFHATEPVWNGFSSGKVRVSVHALDYVADTANFCISSLFGYDFTDENVFIENEEPIITVNADERFVQYNADNDRLAFTPYAVVGGNYTVPTATAIDAYAGNLKVSTKVYHNYASSSHRIEYPIKNGTFYVDLPGVYTIVYTATDYMGNVAKKSYWVTAVQELDNPLAITIDAANATIEGVCGAQMDIAEWETVGGSGDATVSVKAICGDTVLDATNGSFIPEKAGTWTVEYSAKDYAGIEVKEQYTVSIDWGTQPVFLDEPVLPRYIIPGIEYSVPYLYANDYSTQTLQRRLAEVTIKDAQGSKTYKAGEKFKPVANVDTTHITFEFSVDGTKLQKDVPVAPAITKVEGQSYLYIEKMFLGENYTATRTTKGLEMLAVNDGSFDWIFANAVIAENASLQLRGITGQSDFEGVTITFTDYENANIAVTVYIENSESGNAIVTIGNSTKKLLDGFGLGKDSKGNPLDRFACIYKLGKFYLNDFNATVTVDDNGNAFNGFPSNRVYISSKVVNAQKGSGYTVESVDNTVINKIIMDVTNARIEISGVYGGLHEINDTYVVTKAYVSDTIDANVICHVTVKSPSGEIVKDINGVFLNSVPADCEYEFKLSQYGQYMVEYSAIDWATNKATKSYAVNVFDRRAPMVVVADTWSATAKVGEKVVLPQVYIVDSASELKDMKVYRFVRTPQGFITTFGLDFTLNEEGNLEYTKYTYTFRYAGVYKFYVVGYDKTGNQTVVEYVVTVQ